MLPDELRFELAEYRRKAVEGTLSLDEMRNAVRLMREGRVTAAARSTASKARKAGPDSDALLDDLLGA